MKKLILFTSLILIITQCKKSENKTNSTTDSIQALVNTLQADTTNAIPATLADDGYKNNLAALPVQNQSIRTALELFKTKYTSQNPLENDQAFKIFMDFQKVFIDQLNDKLLSSPGYQAINTLVNDDSTAYSEEGKEYKKNLASTGLTLVFEMGDASLQLNTKMVKDYFYTSLSPAGKKYLTLSALEITESPVSDGGLSISLQSVADRLGAWNNFLMSYPPTVFNDAAQENRKSYWYLFLNGIDNTPTFDETNKIFAESLEAYRYYVKTYPATPDAPLIEEYLSLLAQSRFQKNDKIVAFLAKHG